MLVCREWVRSKTKVSPRKALHIMSCRTKRSLVISEDCHGNRTSGFQGPSQMKSAEVPRSSVPYTHRRQGDE